MRDSREYKRYRSVALPTAYKLLLTFIQKRLSENVMGIVE